MIVPYSFSILHSAAPAMLHLAKALYNSDSLGPKRKAQVLERQKPESRLAETDVIRYYSHLRPKPSLPITAVQSLSSSFLRFA